MILAALLQAGMVVLQPFGDNQRYDLVVDENGEFFRIQCKTASLQKGCLVFPACSSYTHHGKGKRSYRGQIELFGVYSPDLQKVYLIPVDEVGESHVYLRLTPPLNSQKTGIRY